MTINFTQESVLSTSDPEADKEWVKEIVKIYNVYLELSGSIWANQLREALCVKTKKSLLKDGWISDPEDSEHSKIKTKFKIENGELIVTFNEEKDILNSVFDE